MIARTILALLLLSVQAWGGEVAYHLDLAAAASHQLGVLLEVDDAPSPLDLTMPLWTPGAYERREWGRNVFPLGAEAAGRSLAVRRLGPSTFRVEGHPAGVTVRLRYQVHAATLTDDGSHLDAHHAYLNGTSVFLRVVGGEGRRHRVVLPLAAGRAVATTLDEEAPGAAQPARFTAPDYEALVDAPIEIGALVEATITVDGHPLRVVIDRGPRPPGEPASPVPSRLLDDLAALLRAQVRLVGAPPFRRYLLLVHLDDGLDHLAALEHRAGASLVAASSLVDDEDEADELRFVLAHELFHTWNGRRLRPEEVARPDFDRTVPSRALWIVEGMTDFFAHRALLEAGLRTPEQHLAHLAEEIERVWNDPLRDRLSLEEESALIWQPADEAADDPLVFYARGHLAALAIDLELRQRGRGERSLTDVARRLLTAAASRPEGFLPVGTAALLAAAEAVAGGPLPGLAEAWITRPGEPPLAPLLRRFAIELRTQRLPPRRGLGALVEPLGDETVVTAVAPGGPAAKAGLRVGDRLLGIDGEAVRPGPRRELVAGGDLTTLRVARHRRILRLVAAASSASRIRCRLVQQGEAPAEAKRRRAGLLLDRRRQ